MDDRHAGLGFRQFVALIAALMAVNALAIDAMLPALGQIGTALGLHHANERQWIVSAYMVGFGAAQIVYGPLADRYGRRPVLIVALSIYVVCSVLAAASWSFGLILAARALQGLGAAGTRVLVSAIVRDCYAGRTMARVMSLAFMIFLGVPILAPSLGQLIMLVAPWPWIFIALAVYGLGVLVWVLHKLPETLRDADRSPIKLAPIAAAFRLTLGNRYSSGYTVAMTLSTGAMLGFLNSSQQIFADVFHHPTLFPAVFAFIAASIACAALLNARLVERLGSRLLSHAALCSFIVVAALHVVVALAGLETIWSFAILQSAQMFCFGVMLGNFGAMAMEPLGHIAGTAASIQGFFSTLGGAAIGILVGQSFNGTTLPMAAGFAVCGLLALTAVLFAESGQLFRSQAAIRGTQPG